MTTPRNSMTGAVPADPMKGPISMYPVQRRIPRRVPSMVGPTQGFFLRESKALGAVQIMNGLFHIAIGGFLLIHTEVYVPICVILWYPFWGGIMFIISGSLLAAAAEKNSRESLVKGKIIMNSLSLFAAISGVIFLIMDIFNITISHFFKMKTLNFIKVPTPYINIHDCEPANPTDKNSLSMKYCDSIRSVFLGIFALLLIFALCQKLVTAGIVETEWKKMCSRRKANIVLLSAEEKKEQAIEIKEEVVEQPEIAPQPKNEEDIEIIPVQEEEEETEINFPEPPEEQESSPIENDGAP
ncbi:B-lymphocyte antigen CD20 [Vicugna pacos]|uniref:B-lymphocyte antigen CD20 n=1 Tax=Vicugna pacos TaxID=30538 RepID=A0A6I9IL36_VICPA|nr:B-lymphocyte antigen CD20 [Vicugna pacos]